MTLVASQQLESSTLNSLRDSAALLADRIVANRRKIHAFPELGMVLPKTQQVILDELARIGVDSIRTGDKLSSVVADIVGTAASDTPARMVALRADMDALPLHEHNDLDFGSQVVGAMHACGHDAHVSMLIGAAEILVAQKSKFSGTVRLLFQPGEEGFGGAKVMIDEGCLEGVDAAFALHMDPSSPTGTLCIRKGTIMASTDNFAAVFRGAGGHASMPQYTRDPIPAIGPFVDGLSHVVARETDPDDRVVLSVTQVRAGSASNVVPPTAECSGTVRALSPKGRSQAHERLRRVARGVAEARGLEVDVTFEEGYPPTVNHDAPVELFAHTAEQVGLRVVNLPSPIMGAEDFSYVLQSVPGAFAFLGAKTQDGGPLHSDLMKIDESSMHQGAALHAATALTFLAQS